MKRLLLLATMLVVTGGHLAWGQYNTPTVNGTIAAGEYGTHTNGQNQQTNGSVVWYITWNATDLYIGISGATAGDAAVFYLDFHCLSPVNGGTNTQGTLVGQSYDNTSFAELQFRADLVIYAKNSYREYRTANGSNGWSSSTVDFGSFSNMGSTREFSIPWSVIGGIPSCFNWFGYVTNNSGSVNGTMPPENAGGSITNIARYARYYTVSSTANGAATKPFSRNSYVFTNNLDIPGFGAITVYDFTMNNASYTITRASGNGGAWTINGNLLVNNGVVDFGSTTNTATVTGAVSIGAGGTLTLSSAAGGDLNVGGNFTQSGTFNCNNREVTFNGSSTQTLSGNFTGSNRFDYLRTASTGLSLSSAVDIEDRLDFDAGLITLNAADLTLYSGISLLDADASRYVATTGSGNLVRNGVGNSATLFPVGTATSYNPVTLTNAGTSDNFLVRVQDSFAQMPTNSTKTVQRQWVINESVVGDSDLSVDLQWNASEEGTNFNRAGDLVIGRHDGTAYVETAASLSGSNPYIASASGFTSLSPFAVGTLNALPVELSRFQARIVDQIVWLSWTTDSEQNNAYFEIERSTDSRKWTSIGVVNGQGTSYQQHQYQFADDKPLTGTSYYRLRQVDVDGQWEYSQIAPVVFGTGLRLLVYPSPAKDEITIDWGRELDGGERALLVDLSGRQIATLLIPSDETRKTWNIADQPPGLYRVVLMDREGQILAQEKLVKTDH